MFTADAAAFCLLRLSCCVLSAVCCLLCAAIAKQKRGQSSAVAEETQLVLL